MMRSLYARSLVALLTGVALSVLAAGVQFAIRPLFAADAALAPRGGTGCPDAIVDYTFLAYDGPVGISGACLAHYRYTGGRLTVVAYDRAQDGLFHNSFESPQPTEDVP